MIKLTNPFTRGALEQALLALEARHPKVTLGLGVAVSAAGYLLLALPPLLLLIGLFKVPAGISSAGSISAWLGVLLWLVITGLGAIITYGLLRVRPVLPSGLGLKEDKAPRIHELLGEMGETYKIPRIHRVTLHDQYELQVVPVPRFGLPLLTENVLYIGLPVLQGLSPMQFRGALARRLGQYSAVHNKLSHFVYLWRQYCRQYQRAYAKHTSPVYLPLQWFYKIYTPVTQHLTASAIRQDELQADIYALELLNDTELADTLVRYEVCRVFLQTKYWPKIHAMLRKQPGNPGHLPHANMAKVMRKALTDNEFAQTLKDLINQVPTWQNELPGLHARLENIGQSKLDMPPPVMETAAQRYMDEAFAAVVKLLDKQWLAKYGKPSKKSPTAPPTGSVKRPESDTPSAKATQQPRQKTSARPSATPQADDTATEQVSTAGIIVDEEVSYEHLHNVSSDDAAMITVTERKRLAELKQKSQHGKLGDNEAWELANLTEKLEDKSLAITLYQQVLRQNPNHAKTLYAVGRILLSKNDPSGVKALERAMELDKGCIAQGCWMLAKHFKASGDDALSRKYLERAANVSAAA